MATETIILNLSSISSNWFIFADGQPADLQVNCIGLPCMIISDTTILKCVIRK